MDLAIVIIYFLTLIFIGTRSYKLVKSVSSFFVADRMGTTIFIASSLFATIIGGSSTVGMAGLGYKNGLVGAWWLLVGAIGLFILSIFFAEKVRGYSLYTLPEILEKHYGNEAKLIASGLIIIAWMGVIAGQIVAAGKILGIIINLPLFLLMIIVALIFITYTLLGGQHSIVKTDAIQGVIIISAILLVVPLCLNEAGGISLMQEVLDKNFFSFPVSEHFTWKTLTTYIFLVGSTYVVGPDIYSRLFCAKNKKIAKRAALITSLTLVPFSFIIVIIGMTARILFPQINPEEAFPTIISHIFPIGVNGIVIAALLSAIMSSADTCLLTTSTIISVDIIKPMYKKDIPEKKLLKLSRIFIAVIGVFSLIIALEIKGVISSLLLGYAVYTSGLVFPVLLGFYKDRLKLNKEGAISAMAVGGGLALFGKILGLNDFALYGFFLSGFVLIAGSRLSLIVKNKKTLK